MKTTITRFTPYEIQECLFDKKRSFDFLSAINESVKKDDIVVDAGSGSGILGLFAARAGAKKVFCIESNPRFIEVIKKNAEINHFSNVIEAIYADATKIKLPCEVDVIICELLSTGFFYEPEIQVINHLRKFLKKGGKIIPMNCKSWIQLVNAQKDIYGLRFDYDSRYEKLVSDKSMSNKVIFDNPNFYIDESLNVDKKIIVTARKSGLVNAVRISNKAQLSENIFATQSEFLFNPLVIFIKRVSVIKDKKYQIHIRYQKSKDTLGTKIDINEIK